MRWMLSTKPGSWTAWTESDDSEAEVGLLFENDDESQTEGRMSSTE